MDARHFKITRNIIEATLLILIVAAPACKKLVEVEPPSNALTSDNIYENDATAISVITGQYSFLSSSPLTNAQSITSISLLSGLSGDELSLYGGTSNTNELLVQFYQNKLLPGPSANPELSIWNSLYGSIYVVNLALEKLNGSNTLTPSVKQHLTGEAKFLRALDYFYLVNLYGDVPLTTASDYRITSTLPRSSRENVYNQIISDLQQAQGLLAQNYLGGDVKTITSERTRPNKWAATALLARAYLYKGDWADAEIQSNNIINNTSVYDTVSLNNVFLQNSKEAIWQLQPVNKGWNTEDARVFILPSSGPSTAIDGYPVFISNQLLNTFEAGDKRKTSWIGSVMVGSGSTSATYYYPYKYKSATLNAPVTEYRTVLRLGEQYLIRAEARAQLNKISEGLKDLNIIRHRAGLSDAAATDQTSLLNLIYHERQVELFTEWGHRWLDLKRTGKIDEVMSSYSLQKGTTWSPNWALYPLPLYDITQNPNLTQNPGY